MKRSKRYIALGIVLGVILLLTSPGVLNAARTAVDSWLRDSSGYVIPQNSSDTIGASGARVSNGFFTNLNISGTCTGCGGGSLTGGSAGMLSSWVNSTTLTATGTPTAAAYTATSTTATSTFAGGITGPNNFTVQSSSGRVGIGIANPTSNLNISAAGLVSATLTSTDSSQANITLDGGYGQIQTNAGILYLTSGNSDIVFRPNTTEYGRWLSTGNLGIGTTSPYAKLSVVGQIVAPYITATSTTATSTFAGAVGIGSAVPLYKLHVEGGSGLPIGYFKNTNSFGSVTGTEYGLKVDGYTNLGGFRINGADPANSIYQTSGSMGFTVNTGSDITFNQFGGAGEVMRIANGGNVGLGSTSPYMRLVASTTESASGTNVAILDTSGKSFAEGGPFLNFAHGGQLTAALKSASGVSNTNPYLAFYVSPNSTSPVEVGRFSKTGFFGIGTTSPYAALSVSGQVVSDSVFATSTTATSTFKGGLDLSTALVEQHIYSSFSYATTTAWTGTTTIQLGPAYTYETWNGVKCYTDVGTVNVQFFSDANRLNMLNASTTIGTFGFSTNNAIPVNGKRSIDIGTPASSPTRISCTVDKTVNK